MFLVRSTSRAAVVVKRYYYCVIVAKFNEILYSFNIFRLIPIHNRNHIFGFAGGDILHSYAKLFKLALLWLRTTASSA